MLSQYAILFVLPFCLAAAKRDCKVDGRTYKDGQQFDQGCTARCTCNNGNVGCVSMCPPFAMPPNCRRVKNSGECCEHGECPNDATCEKSVSPSGGRMKSPWSAKCQAGRGANAKTCMCTIIGPKTLLTPEACASPTDDVTFNFPKGQSWRKKSVKKMPFINHAHQITLEEPIAYSKEIHEVNMPWPGFCTDDACALYLSSFKNDNETEFVQAKKATKDKCNIDPSDTQTSCLEINQSTRPSCTFLDGSSVAVRKGQTFYIIGMILGGPTPKDSHKCDTNKDRYRKYINMCNQLNAVAQQNH